MRGERRERRLPEGVRRRRAARTAQDGAGQHNRPPRHVQKLVRPRRVRKDQPRHHPRGGPAFHRPKQQQQRRRRRRRKQQRKQRATRAAAAATTAAVQETGEHSGDGCQPLQCKVHYAGSQ